MHPYPHRYRVTASGATAGTIPVLSNGVPDLQTAAPAEFDGPGDQWSPESLLAAALASCFILTFRAVARGSKLEWSRLECEVEAVLERVEGVTRFTRIITKAKLQASESATEEQCRRALEKAEHACLVANSLNAQRELQAEVVRL